MNHDTVGFGGMWGRVTVAIRRGKSRSW